MEFFTQQEINIIDSYAKQPVEEEKFQQLKKTYDKLENLCQLICKNPDYVYQIRKDPRKQAGRSGFVFQDYLWAKVYPTEFKAECSDKLAHIIGLSDGTIHFHIMGVKDFYQTQPSTDATKASWIEFRAEELSGYEELIGNFYQYAKEYHQRFIQTAVELQLVGKTNTLPEMNNSEILKLLLYKKQIILQGPPGTGKTKLAKELANAVLAGNKLSSAEIRTRLSIGLSFKSATAYTSYTVKAIEDTNISLSLENSSSVYKPSYVEIIKAYETRMWEGGQEKGNDPYAAAIAKYLFENASEAQTKIIQFHSSYSYEDFVRGIVAESKGERIEYRNVNKLLGLFAAEALENWNNYYKDNVSVSRENRTKEYFEAFAEEISDRIADGESIVLTPSVKLVDVEEDAFRYKGTDGWSALGNRMLFKDIIRAFLDENKTRQDIKKNKNISGLAVQHASYFVRVLNLFQEYVRRNNLLFEQRNTDKAELKDYVLIIDEINRANLSSVLGELIYALEYRGQKVESMYKVEGSGTALVLPPNLYIIGTMNTADRSVGHIDYAIRRRFAFVDVLPTDLSGEPNIKFHKPLFDAVAALFDNYLSAEFDKKDVQLGHSYFIDKTGDGGSMAVRLQYEIKPLLMEYIKDGVLRDSEKLQADIAALNQIVA